MVWFIWLVFKNNSYSGILITYVCKVVKHHPDCECELLLINISTHHDKTFPLQHFSSVYIQHLFIRARKKLTNTLYKLVKKAFHSSFAKQKQSQTLWWVMGNQASKINANFIVFLIFITLSPPLWNCFAFSGFTNLSSPQT